ANAVIAGSGINTREVIKDEEMMSLLKLDPRRQLIASQCSGALILIRLGLLQNRPICTDMKTRPTVVAAGYSVLDRPFHAAGNVATAGGCLSSEYLAAWMIYSILGRQAAVDALSYVAPVGDRDHIANVLRVVEPFVPVTAGREAV